MEAKIMCCCINNLVQTQDNTAKDIYARLNHCGISMNNVKASTLMILVNETRDCIWNGLTF